MTRGDWITIAVMAALAAGIFFGIRRGKQGRSSALAAARAEGHAEAKAELAAQLTQTVQVVNGSGNREGYSLSTDEVRRIVAGVRAGELARDTRGNDDDDDAIFVDDIVARYLGPGYLDDDGEYVRTADFVPVDSARQGRWPLRRGDFPAAGRGLESGHSS
jgi:hypothetical protein